MNTSAYGINSRNAVVGTYVLPTTFHNRGFLFWNGTFAKLSYPGAPDTFATGINEHGAIVGAWFSGSGGIWGFEFN